MLGIEQESKYQLTLLYAIGNLLQGNEGNKAIASDMGLEANVSAITVDDSKPEAKLIKELKTYYSRVLK